MSRQILIVVEVKDDSIKNVSKEILSFCTSKTANLKDEFSINALIYGDKINQSIFDEIANCGVKNIICINDKRLIHHNPQQIIPTMVSVIKEINPELVLFGNTSCGKDFAPWLSQYFNANMVSDCIDIEFLNETIMLSKMIFGGKLLENIEILSKETLFVTIRPNVLGMHTCKKVIPCVNYVDYIVNNNNKYSVKGMIKKSDVQVPIDEAEIIVAGGRAFKSKADFEILHQLANTMEATVGASRPIIDLGIKRRSLQIGQSGKSVAPKLIFLCGISGQIQFVAGIANAGTVISINKDSKATIFKSSDYGIVGDVYKIIPILTSKLKKVMQK